MMPGRRYTPATIWWIVKRRKWLLTVPFVLTTTAAATITFNLKDRYRAQTTILVVPQRVPESYVRPAINESIEQRLQSIGPQIMSESRLARIATELDLYPGKRNKKGGLDEIVEDMRSDISIDIIKGDLFKVTYSGEDPYKVMQVTQRLASLFVEENLKDREQLVTGTSKFLESQLEKARQQLEVQERRIQEYRQRHAGELPSQTGSNLQVLQTAALQLQGIEEAIGRDHDRRLELERTLSDLTEAQNARQARAVEAAPATPAATPAADLAAATAPPDAEIATIATTGDFNTKYAQLQKLQQTLQNLQLRLKPDHPDVVRTKRLIGELQRALGDNPGNPGAAQADASAMERRARLAQVRAQIANLDNDLTRKTADQDRLKKLIATYQNRVESEPERESEMIELTRDYDTVQGTYRSLLAKKEEAGIAANLEQQQGSQQFRTLDPARLPEKPYGPNRTMIDAVGAFFGVFFGLGTTILLEIRDQSFRNPLEVLPTLSLPVLASVPEVLTASERRRAKQLAASLVFLCLTMIVGGVILAYRAGILHFNLKFW